MDVGLKIRGDDRWHGRDAQGFPDALRSLGPESLGLGTLALRRLNRGVEPAHGHRGQRPAPPCGRTGETGARAGSGCAVAMYDERFIAECSNALRGSATGQHLSAVLRCCSPPRRRTKRDQCGCHGHWRLSQGGGRCGLMPCLSHCAVGRFPVSRGVGTGALQRPGSTAQSPPARSLPLACITARNTGARESPHTKVNESKRQFMAARHTDKCL